MIALPRRRTWLVSLPFTVAILSAASVHAQAVATDFNELRLKVKAGDTVYVTAGGDKERRAQILELTPSSLAVAIAGERRELTEDSVTRIRQRRADPLWNGAAIGAGVSAALMAGAAAAFSEGTCDERCVAGITLYVGIGAAAGAGIDALIKGRKPIYEAPGRRSSHVVIRPALSPVAKGLSVSFGW